MKRQNQTSQFTKSVNFNWNIRDYEFTFPLDPSQAQSIMSFTRGRTRWKNHRPHRRTFALNHIAALRIGICVWITSLLTTGVMAVKNQNSKCIF